MLLSLLLLSGCNSYEVFRVTGFEQANFSNDADILFIVDNSGSMQPEASDLAINFHEFIGQLTAAEGSNVPRATLADAVGSYLREKSGNGTIDYQLGLINTSVDYTNGADPGIEPGEAGLLVGEVINRSTPDAAVAFQDQLLCQTTCWSELELAVNPDHVCGDPLEDEVTIEYLDCACGVDLWRDHCGAGTEEGLEAGLMALCRAVDTPPDVCFEYVDPVGGTAMTPTVFNAGDAGSNAGFLREGANTILVIVTDEGDGSRRMAIADTDVAPYLEAFSTFENPVRIAVIGPPHPEDEEGVHDDSCLDGALGWGVERYQNAAAESSAVYIDLTNIDEGCAPNDFSENLKKIGDLLSTLLTIFELQSYPDAASIQVWVDGERVAHSELLSGAEETHDAVYGDGWNYEAAYNAVKFNGAAVPAYNADVRIYYLPLGGTPRELPF